MNDKTITPPVEPSDEVFDKAILETLDVLFDDAEQNAETDDLQEGDW